MDEAHLPTVTVQLPIYNERYVATRLVIAIARLNYPRERLRIQVLDDSTDLTRQRLAVLTRRLRALGIPIDHLHRERRHGFKAGALAAGLACDDSELVAIFDADFVPPPGFLRQIVPDFMDPEIGMVQARWSHLNREDSLLTRLQSIFLDGHFFIEHVARHGSGRFFNFNGTAGVWRRSCIEDAGGWSGDTLTEDLDLSYRAQLRGWRFSYRPELTAAAELPIDMNAFKRQQHRWAKGSVQTALKLLPRIMRSPLPWRIKLEALFHLANNLNYLFIAIPCLLWVPTLSRRYDTDEPWMLAMAGAMAATTLCVVGYHMTCQRAAGQSWSGTLRILPALLSLGIGLSLNNGRAVVEALVGHPSAFERTPKYGVTRRAATVKSMAYALRHDWLSWLELSMAAYFGFGLWFAIDSGRFIAIPFLLLFLAGFLYVGLSSLGRQIDQLLTVGSACACLGLLGFVAWISHAFLLARI
jgi:hypothetical protein